MISVSFFTQLHIGLQRMVRWEFWPWRVVYLPIAVYWFYLAIRARGWVFFSAANPCMRFGGLVAYSKSDVIKLVPESFLPKTIFLEKEMTEFEILSSLENKGMTFPLVIKPDMGERGRGVKIIKTEADLKQAISILTERMLLQVYEDLPMEIGVMYSRKRDEVKGSITSVVVKDFPVVIGDGKSTLLELILKNLRTRLSYKVHLKRFADRLSEVPKEGETIRMVTIGNHRLGTTFLDGNHLISEQLEAVFDSLAKQIDGFYLGRFDLRTNSIEDLLEGKFKVIEVNGVNSEPCHIYDSNVPLWKGIHDLLTHWKRIFEISVANHNSGVSYASYFEIRAELKRHKAEVAKYD
ncbi:D-alanine--D-alanine ligase [Bacteroidota bacterium]